MALIDKHKIIEKNADLPIAARAKELLAKAR